MANIKKKANEYSFSEFRSDISWFIHNCNVKHSHDKSILEACFELENFVDEEIRSSKDCSECYEILWILTKGYTLPCSKKHKMIWAKSSDFCYFPAKCLREWDDGSVSVHYFGDNTVDRVSRDSFCEYSAKCPDDGSTSELYALALSVSLIFTIYVCYFYTVF